MKRLLQLFVCVVLLPIVAMRCGADDGPAPNTDGAAETIDPDATDTTAVDPGPPAPGALVGLSLTATVGVHLGDLPEPARTEAVAWLLERPAEFWVERARRQIELTSYRLHHRNTYHLAATGRHILPLPPLETWKIDFEGASELRERDGHTIVARDYTFTATLLGPPGSPGASDPDLTAVGGTTLETFVLPVDPDHLLERTGRACINTLLVAPDSIDPANARFHFDDRCRPGPASGGRGACHRQAPFPTQACSDAVSKAIGGVSVDMRFEHLPWDDALAAQVRVGTLTADVADLRAVAGGLDDHQVVFRHFAPNACAVVRGCVGGPGWRRLLQYSAPVENAGAVAVVIGDTRPGSQAANERLVSADVCDNMPILHRYRLLFHGDRGQRIGALRGSCVENTRRTMNHEGVALMHGRSCEMQGLEPGWSDAGYAGNECQWVDVTDIDTSQGGNEAPLGFLVNPDRMLCEGVAEVDGAGGVRVEKTTLTNALGETEARVVCAEADGVRANNQAVRTVTVPFGNGGSVTGACPEGAFGPLRDCGFKLTDVALACVPGAETTLRCEAGAGPAVVRVCESSDKRGVMPCRAVDALLSKVAVGGAETTWSFVCPAARAWPETERGGGVGVFVGALIEGAVADATCEVVR